MARPSVWRDAFIERFKATGNVTLAASGAGVTPQHVYRTRSGSARFSADSPLS